MLIYYRFRNLIILNNTDNYIYILSRKTEIKKVNINLTFEKIISFIHFINFGFILLVFQKS